eukprot:s673_g5.t1
MALPAPCCNGLRGLARRWHGAISAAGPCEILAEMPGYIIVNKPWDVSFRSLREVLRTKTGKDSSFAPGPSSPLASGALAAALAMDFRAASKVTDLHAAVLRGRLSLNETITVRSRLCQPSEGSRAWRLSGRRTEGVEACTLFHGVLHGTFQGEVCTLIYARPVTRLPQQLLLHSVALGHPVVGDRLHDADRRLDFRFSGKMQSKRLLLHCAILRLPACGEAPGASKDIAVPHDFGALLGAKHEALPSRSLVSHLMSADAAAGLTSETTPREAWDDFAGGLSRQIVDDTPWDSQPVIRRAPGPPFGPAEWDERTQKFEERQAQRAQRAAGSGQ